MEPSESEELYRGLADRGVTEVGPVYTYSGHIEGKGEITFLVKDLGRTPRWSVQAFNDAGERLGGDVEDSLPIAISGLFNKPGLRQ